MQLYEIIYLVLALYILYKLVFNFVLPVSKAATSVRDQMQNMNNQQTGQQKSSASSTPDHVKKKNAAGTDSEYIDFEEIK